MYSGNIWQDDHDHESHSDEVDHSTHDHGEDHDGHDHGESEALSKSSASKYHGASFAFITLLVGSMII